MDNDKYWEKKDKDKDERIGWYNAKNNATALASAVISKREVIPDRKLIQEDIESWANWIYQLEPTVAKKETKKMASDKQKNFIIQLKNQKGEPAPADQWLNSLSPFQAKQEIDRLLQMQTLDFGDRPFDENIEGTKEDDYDKSTGQLK